MAPMKSNINLAQETAPDSSLVENISLSPASQALHADDHLRSTPDIAPPLHVSTNFHYPSNPDDLVPAKDLDVSSSPTPQRLRY